MEVNLKKLSTVTVVSMLYDQCTVDADDVLCVKVECRGEFQKLQRHLLRRIGPSSYRVVVQPKMFKLLLSGKLTLSH